MFIYLGINVEKQACGDICVVYTCVYAFTYVCIWLCRHICVKFLISLCIYVLCTSYKISNSFIKQCYFFCNIINHWRRSVCSPTSAPPEGIVWPECETRLQDFRFVYHLSQERSLPVVIHYGDRTHMCATVKYNGNSRNIHPPFFFCYQQTARCIINIAKARRTEGLRRTASSVFHPSNAIPSNKF
jgi:hypothetical protein